MYTASIVSKEIENGKMWTYSDIFDITDRASLFVGTAAKMIP